MVPEVKAKLLGFAPVNVMPVMVRLAPVPVLVSVMGWGGLVVP